MNSTPDEGYIKFHCRWHRTRLAPFAGLEELLEVRAQLFALGWVGAYPDGVGYGNLSLRLGGGRRFAITGSATGGLREVDHRHLAVVVEYDIGANAVVCRGEVRASSESMSHAAVYECDAALGAVIHIHHHGFWTARRGDLPTTGEGVPYGTPRMARELQRLWKHGGFSDSRILVMGGHPGGILSCGADLEAAKAVLMAYREELR